MNNKIILTDADGCLLNWTATFNVFMHSKGLPSLPGTESNYSVETKHGITRTQTSKLIKEFNHSDYIADLHPFADAKDYVAKLNSEGYKFICITSLSEKPSAYDYRAQNLKKHFGDAIIGLHCLRIGIHKGEKLKQWQGTNLFWIEDHVGNAAAGAELGLRAIVVDHPYNTRYTEYDHLLHARVSYERPWEDIYKLIKAAE